MEVYQIEPAPNDSIVKLSELIVKSTESCESASQARRILNLGKLAIDIRNPDIFHLARSMRFE